MKKTAIFVLIMLFVTSLHAQIDSKATRETKILYQYLKTNSGKKIHFGHHFTTRVGIDFFDKTQCGGQSDVLSSVGDFPAVFSFDFNAGFASQLDVVKKAYQMGAIITFSYHAPNPVTKDGYRSKQCNEVAEVLPNGALHKSLINTLDSIAWFAKSAKYNNKQIPIILRPWHEHTGRWFWWGSESSTPDEFIQLWKFTVEYLRDTKQVHNFLYAYSPSHPSEYGGYETRNPGPDYFDIAGFDCYGKENFKDKFLIDCELTVKYAEKHDKIPAIAEFGYSKGLQNSIENNWYMTEFFEPLFSSPYAKKIVYALTWRNDKDAYWVPLKQSPYYPAFKQFYEHPYTAFLSETNYKQCKTK